MTDNGDGTYTGQWMSHVEGNVTVTIFHMPSNVYVQCYDNSIFDGDPSVNKTINNINEAWGTGNVCHSLSDNVSMRLYFVIEAPYTETYTFNLLANDGADLYINGVRQINQLGNTCDCDDSFDIDLVAGNLYDFK